MPTPEAFSMPMPGPFAGAQQNFPYPQAPQYPSATQAYYPSQNQWYLGSELPPIHSQPVPHGMLKVPGYDPKGDAQAITNATKGRSLDKKEKEMRAFPFSSLRCMIADFVFFFSSSSH
jgi:annexin A7/11